jgi:hypothetical protein
MKRHDSTQRVSLMTSVCYYKSPKERNLHAEPRLNDTRMKCERCLRGEEARYRVYTDAMEMVVCAACADEARNLEITVEPLSRE